MTTTTPFDARSTLPHPPTIVFDWHDRPGAFERLTPPFEPVSLVEHVGGIRDGARVVIRIKNGPITLHWHARHEGYERPRRFVDVQDKGPFACWRHDHLFQEAEGGACVMHDSVRYRLPGGPIGSALGGAMTRKKLRRMFAYRHDALRRDLDDHAVFANQPRRTVVITGASGLVGSQLAALLTTGGHTVRRLVRSRTIAAADGEVYFWDPRAGEIDAAAFDGADAVVHLAGESVFAPRWTKAKKQRILDSRERGTALVVRGIAEAGSDGPSALVSASAVGYYGESGDADEPVTEPSGNGEGFLADVCRRWEAEASRAEDSGVRVALARIGVVLSPRGGALKLMKPAFALGLGGPIGSGRQRMPWITVDDAVRALHFAVMRDDVVGPMNLVTDAPEQRDFAKVLGRVLGRPAIAPAPSWAIKAVMGEVAREAFLKGVNADPAALRNAGFTSRDGALEPALRRLLGRFEPEQLGSGVRFA